MPFTERGNHRIHYQTWGDPSSPPLLLIMGLALSSQAWRGLPEKLAKRFFVLTFDNRGTGESAAPRMLLRMRELADDAAAVLEAAGVPPIRDGHGGAAVFGISMGGMIAQELTLRHPDRVRALALGATYHSYVLSRKPALSATMDLMRLVAAGRRRDPVILGRLILSPEFMAARPDEVARWTQNADAPAVTSVLAQLVAVVGHSTRRRLSKISVPTLVLSGDADRLIPVKNSYALARIIPGARLELLRGAGHAFPLEREDETLRLLVEHFGAPPEATRQGALG